MCAYIHSEEWLLANNFDNMFYFSFHFNIQYCKVMFFTVQIPFQTGRRAAPLVLVRHFAAERRGFWDILFVGASV